MIDPSKIILSSIQTEKAFADKAQNKYHFLVDFKANKHQIKKAFERAFKVTPIAINTKSSRSRSKFSWRNRATVKTGNTKIAIITLSSKDKIDIMETKK